MREHFSFPLPLCGFNVCVTFNFGDSLFSLSLFGISIYSFFSLFSVVYDFEQKNKRRKREVGCTSMCAVHLDLSIDTRNREKKRGNLGKFLSLFLHYFSVPLFLFSFPLSLSLSLSLTFLCFSLIILFEG